MAPHRNSTSETRREEGVTPVTDDPSRGLKREEQGNDWCPVPRGGWKTGVGQSRLSLS